MNAPQICRAKLIPMKGDTPETDEKKHIEVQFNPATLRVSLSNTLKADSKGGGQAAAQFVDKSESSLSIELLFDTSVERPSVPANSDVRTLTQRIADTFMKPQDADTDKPKAPLRCRFQWGSFQFSGMVSSYSETLDFFAPEGIPLRSTLSLSLKEDRYQFDYNKDFKGYKPPREMPKFVPGGPGVTADKAAASTGRKPAAWRDVANANDMENPRQAPDGNLAIPPEDSTKGTV